MSLSSIISFPAGQLDCHSRLLVYNFNSLKSCTSAHAERGEREAIVDASGESLWFILMLKNRASLTRSVSLLPLTLTTHTHAHTSSNCLFSMGPKGDFMDGLRSNHLQLTNQWETHSAPRLENSTTTKRKHNVSGTYQVHMMADTHTETQDRASLTVIHISSFTVNDSWCLCVFAGLKVPYDRTHVAACSAATHEAS